jgi:hypothetical protein
MTGFNGPLESHPYHDKTTAELYFIARDAHAAAKAMQDLGDSVNECKYLDQVNDACTVMYYRRQRGICK